MHTGTHGVCLYQATTSWQLDGLVDQGVNPTPVMGRLTARRIHACGEETESNCAVSSGGGFQQQIEHVSVQCAGELYLGD